jgi:uncharacterized membrane protein YcaP (DUF421 family)
MNLLIEIFGQGKDLNALQMSCRGIVVLLIALALVRVSGRRSFGLHTPLDNIITISLGAILSRAVVGASPFIPVIICCFVIVLLHRMLGWLVSRNNRISKVIEGNKILLFSNGRFNRHNMRRAQVCEEDMMEGVRKSALTDDMDKIDRVYIERNGDISPIRKS